MMQESLLHPDYFASVLGMNLAELLAPVAPERPAGESLRGTALYRQLQEARREDDPTLPQGPWEHELKRADWERVAAVAAEALARRSKDLQLAAWLAEAQVRRAGFLGLAAALTLMEGLCDRYWNEAYPPVDGDLDHRLNIFRWVDEKLLPPLRLVPLTAAARPVGEYAWSDWEQARRNEQLLSAQGSQLEPQLEGATLALFGSALAATPTAFHTATVQSIAEAKRAVGSLAATLDLRCGSDAPSFKALDDLLTDIGLLVTAELRRRGVERVEVRPYAEAPEEAVVHEDHEPLIAADAEELGGREQAYAVLAQVADYLLQVEPHSPVPYLIQRAVEWGQLNTAELYELLFIRHKGQLSVFDMLGIDAARDE